MVKNDMNDMQKLLAAAEVANAAAGKLMGLAVKAATDPDAAPPADGDVLAAALAFLRSVERIGTAPSPVQLGRRRKRPPLDHLAVAARCFALEAEIGELFNAVSVSLPKTRPASQAVQKLFQSWIHAKSELDEVYFDDLKTGRTRPFHPDRNRSPYYGNPRSR